MRCDKQYRGSTCNACVQCGAPMLAGETVCSSCGAEEKTLMSFPWLKCPRCRQKQWSFDFSVDRITWWVLGFGIVVFLVGILGMFFCKNPDLDIRFSRFIITGIALFGVAIICYVALSIKPRRLWWLIWQPFLGILIALLGIFTLSKTCFFIGLILALTWYFSQRCHLKVFDLSKQKISAALARDVFESTMNPDIPEDVKRLKDMNDMEAALLWKMNNVFSKRWLIRLLGFTAVVFILVCKGPGDFYRAEIVANVKNGIEAVNAKIQPTILDAQRRLREVNKKESLKEKLIMCNLSRAQILEILNFGDFDTIIEVFEWKRSHEVGRGEVYGELKNDLAIVIECKRKGLSVEEYYQLQAFKLNAEQILKLGVYPSVFKVASSFAKTLKGDDLYDAVVAEYKPKEEVRSRIRIFGIIFSYFKEVRREAWVIAVLLLFLLSISDIVFIICVIASSIAHRIYSMADEVNDRLKYAWSKVIEKQRKKEALAQNREYVPHPEHESLGQKVKQKGLTWLDVVGIDFIMEIGQLILHKLHPNLQHS